MHLLVLFSYGLMFGIPGRREHALQPGYHQKLCSHQQSVILDLLQLKPVHITRL